MAKRSSEDITDEVHRALRARAAGRGHIMEAEVREILEAAVRPQRQAKLSTLLAKLGRQARLSDEEFALFEQVRDKTPTRPVSFE